MPDFTLVDPKGWHYDLLSVYSAYVGYFETNRIPWWDRSWGHLFSSFEEFLSYSWPVVTLTDSQTGRSHIVTRLTSIGAFLRMVKTRFGETLPQAPNMLEIEPFETSTRPLRTISDYASYKKLHATLPAVALSSLKTRVRAGEPRAIKELWQRKDKTFLSISLEWSERNERSCLEFGYAALRCSHLEAMSVWPPSPEDNYRKGHYIVSDYVDKVVNKVTPTHPWEYAFGESTLVSKTKLVDVITAILSSLSSPDTEMQANTMVLVIHGNGDNIARLEEMKIKFPANMLILDAATFERSLFKAGYRGSMLDPKTGAPRLTSSSLSLENLVRSFGIRQLDGAPAHNSGNDAFKCLFSLQMMLEGVEGTAVPPLKIKRRLLNRGVTMPNIDTGSFPPSSSPFNIPAARRKSSSPHALATEFGQMSMDGQGNAWLRSPVDSLGAGVPGSVNSKRRSYNNVLPKSG